MDINFATVLRDLKGNPVKDGDADATLGTACVAALLANFQDEKDVSPQEKARRFNIALRITNGATSIKADEVVLVKKLVGKMYSVLIVGRAFELLDPDSEPAEVEAAE